MALRRFALIFGIIYVVIGLAGFIPGLVYDAGNNWGPGGGYLLQAFEVNYLHDVVHLLIGAWGIWAYAAATRALTYARFVGILYTVLGLYGLLNVAGGVDLPTESIIPLGSLDAILHLASGVVALFFGFGPPARAARTA